jgi:MFS family permease
VLSFFIGSYAAVLSCVYFLLPLYLQGTLHFSGGQIGLLYAVLNLQTMVASFPVGVCADRYSPRSLTRLGIAATALSLWTLSEIQQFWPFLATYIWFGLGLQFLRQSVEIALFKDESPAAVRRFGHFNSMRMGGMMLGALAGGILIYHFNFPATLKVFSVSILLLLALTGRLPLTRSTRAALFDYGRDFLTRPVLFFAAWLFLFTLHWGAEATSLALFLEHNLGLDPRGVGAYMSGEFAVIALIAYLYGRFWAGRLKPLTFLSLALLTSGAGHILMTYPQIPWSFAWRAVHGLGDGLILMETYTTISRLFHVDRIGGNASLISLVTTLGIFTGALIFGPVGATYGYAWPLIISGAITLALLPLAYAGLKG